MQSSPTAIAEVIINNPLEQETQNLNTTVQYSNNINTKLQYSTVEITTVLGLYSDVIPKDGFYPFYIKMFNKLGKAQFEHLVQRARAGSDTPQRLFCWMLKHPELVV